MAPADAAAVQHVERLVAHAAVQQPHPGVDAEDVEVVVRGRARDGRGGETLELEARQPRPEPGLERVEQWSPAAAGQLGPAQPVGVHDDGVEGVAPKALADEFEVRPRARESARHLGERRARCAGGDAFEEFVRAVGTAIAALVGRERVAAEEDRAVGSGSREGVGAASAPIPAACGGHVRARLPRGAGASHTSTPPAARSASHGALAARGRRRRRPRARRSRSRQAPARR